MKITYNNYMSGYNNTIYSNKVRNHQNIDKIVKEDKNKSVNVYAKKNSESKPVNANIVNNDINLENNMLYYYRSQELKKRRAQDKDENLIKIAKL